MKGIVLLMALLVICSAAYAGTARYSGASDVVKIVHPELGYGPNSLHGLADHASSPVRLPYTHDGLASQMAPGDFVWTVRFSDPQSVLPFSPDIAFETILEDELGNAAYAVFYYQWVGGATPHPQLIGSVTNDGSGQIVNIDNGDLPTAIRMTRTTGPEGQVIISFAYEKGSIPGFQTIGSFELNHAITPEGTTVPCDTRQMTQRFSFTPFKNFEYDEITLEGPTIPDVNNGERALYRPDVNGSGKCDATDVQLVINAVLGRLPVK
ncbi:MAG: hypothetical protein RBU21_14630 [FCB group bacterium]|jgi:hypothetical protein|nr:hypothetical protein [FCB group bacterium]